MLRLRSELLSASFPALRHSVLLRIGALMGFLALLSIISILISTMIAEDISGRASAVNVSGSLRMLSFRTLSELLQPEKRNQALETVLKIERRLLWLERFAANKSSPDAPSARALSNLLLRWENQIRPLEMAIANGHSEQLSAATREIPDFVDDIDDIVRLIEDELESRAKLLRVIQLGLLAVIVLISSITIWLLHHHLVQPLAQLLQAAKTVSRGSFSARVQHVSADELGQLGRAFNTMISEIASMYAHLEEKVAEKTQALTQSKQSLELLYRVSQQLSASDLTLDQLESILAEVGEALAIGNTLLCISEHGHFPARTVIGEFSAGEAEECCRQMDCRNCFIRSRQPLSEQAAQHSLVILPIGDSSGQLGALPIQLPPGTALSPEKARIVETVGHHVSNALLNMRRTEEKHRLAVLEERNVIARELHDSIAQSLSYLKIQVTRLEKCINEARNPQDILSELKTGLSSAYRELRELITTFRLRIDEGGFQSALESTVAEFSKKIGTPLSVNNTMSGLVLSANEEMHIIRIIREALSNTERHAQAQRAGLDIGVDESRRVTIHIFDDGRGFDPGAVPSNHFGTAIMRDRAHILGGTLEVDSQPGRGCRIQLQFTPQHYRQNDSESTA
ncbi:histidine kinase [Azonexus sp.]|uniref:histidine kinase n=1 Tax=Azonexus sp. TaxID=1872668 RepID=UPI0039E6C047